MEEKKVKADGDVMIMYNHYYYHFIPFIITKLFTKFFMNVVGKLFYSQDLTFFFFNNFNLFIF